jgi:hypothetical protein
VYILYSYFLCMNRLPPFEIVTDPIKIAAIIEWDVHAEKNVWILGYDKSPAVVALGAKIRAYMDAAWRATVASYPAPVPGSDV